MPEHKKTQYPTPANQTCISVGPDLYSECRALLSREICYLSHDQVLDECGARVESIEEHFPGDQMQSKVRSVCALPGQTDCSMSQISDQFIYHVQSSPLSPGLGFQFPGNPSLA